MRSRLPLISAVLTVALLLGQWLAATHGPHHELQPSASHDCAVCVYANSAGSGALPTVPVFSVSVVIEAADAAVAANPLAGAVRNHPIRGPPAFLA